MSSSPLARRPYPKTKLGRAQANLRVTAISEGIVAIFALAMGGMAVLSAITGAADAAVADLGIANTATDGRTGGTLFFVSGMFLVVVGVMGIVAAMLGLSAAKNEYRAQRCVVFSAVTLVVAVVETLTALGSGNFLAYMATIVINIAFSVALMRSARKVRDAADA